MKVLQRLDIAVLIMLFFSVWPCFAKDYETYINRGSTYIDEGQYDKAISDYARAIELKPRRADTYYSRGLAYFYKRNYEKAWDDLYKVQNLGHNVHPGFLKALREDQNNL